MSNPDDTDTEDYLVLRNEEGQYSLWPSRNDIPGGWAAVDYRGSKVECMTYVDEHWTEMRSPATMTSGRNR